MAIFTIDRAGFLDIQLAFKDQLKTLAGQRKTAINCWATHHPMWVSCSAFLMKTIEGVMIMFANFDLLLD